MAKRAVFLRLVIDELPDGVTSTEGQLHVDYGKLPAFRVWLEETLAAVGRPVKKKPRAVRIVRAAKKVKGRKWTPAQRQRFLATRAANLVARQAAEAQSTLPLKEASA